MRRISHRREYDREHKLLTDVYGCVRRGDEQQADFINRITRAVARSINHTDDNHESKSRQFAAILVRNLGLTVDTANSVSLLLEKLLKARMGMGNVIRIEDSIETERRPFMTLSTANERKVSEVHELLDDIPEILHFTLTSAVCNTDSNLKREPIMLTSEMATDAMVQEKLDISEKTPVRSSILRKRTATHMQQDDNRSNKIKSRTIFRA